MTLQGSQDSGAWHFFVPWTTFAPEHAGGDAVIQIAGIGHVVGEAAIPSDLRRYVVAPAILAAERVGGSTAEAEEYHRWIAVNERDGDDDRARSFAAQLRDDVPSFR